MMLMLSGCKPFYVAASLIPLNDRCAFRAEIRIVCVDLLYYYDAQTFAMCPALLEQVKVWENDKMEFFLKINYLR